MDTEADREPLLQVNDQTNFSTFYHNNHEVIPALQSSRSNSFDSQISHPSYRTVEDVVTTLSSKVSSSLSSIARDFSLPKSLVSGTYDGNPDDNQIDVQYCGLCLEYKSSGITCKENHFICRNECFASLVSSLCEESYRLRQTKGRIECPVPDCNSDAWSSREVREGLSGHYTALDAYADTILSLLESGVSDVVSHESEKKVKAASSLNLSSSDSSSFSHAQELICDALTLKCPNPGCRFALDPNPDGCCAMKCLKCGCYFCWLCFVVTGIDSQSSHKHVRNCAVNPSSPDGSVFVDEKSVDDAHKNRRLEAIRRTLLGLYGNNWQKNKICAQVIESVAVLLRDSNISKAEVFSSTSIAPPTAGERPAAQPAAGAARNVPRVRGPFAARGLRRGYAERERGENLEAQMCVYVSFCVLGIVSNVIDADMRTFSIDFYEMWMPYILYTVLSTAAVLCCCLCCHIEGGGCCERLYTLVAVTVSMLVIVTSTMTFTILVCQGWWYFFLILIDTFSSGGIPLRGTR